LFCRDLFVEEARMAKKRKRKYSRGAGTEVKREMHRYKRGTARSGKGRTGRQGEKPQAGDRHRAFQGAQEGEESSEEEEIASDRRSRCEIWRESLGAWPSGAEGLRRPIVMCGCRARLGNIPELNPLRRSSGFGDGLCQIDDMAGNRGVPASRRRKSIGRGRAVGKIARHIAPEKSRHAT
jgi:Family of unknown function (DUF6496)